MLSSNIVFILFMLTLVKPGLPPPPYSPLDGFETRCPLRLSVVEAKSLWRQPKSHWRSKPHHLTRHPVAENLMGVLPTFAAHFRFKMVVHTADIDIGRNDLQKHGNL